MMAASGIVLLSAQGYKAVVDGELRVGAQLAMDGAIDLARHDLWSGTIITGQTVNYTVNGRTVQVQMTDNNANVASTALARATMAYGLFNYRTNKVIGLPGFDRDNLAWIYNPANQHWYAAVRIPAGMTWTTAYANAVATVGPGGTNAYLATITSLAERDFIRDSVWPRVQPSNSSAWIGGLRNPGATQVSPGSWSWVTGEAWSYTTFAAGEPNNLSETWLSLNGGQNWHDAGSGTFQWAIIEEGTPDYNWRTDGSTGRRYLYMPNPLRWNWHDALRAAEAIKGPSGEWTSLATIGSASEQTFITGTVLPPVARDATGSTAWIGLFLNHSATGPGGWLWATGESRPWTNWTGGAGTQAAPGYAFLWWNGSTYLWDDNPDAETLRGGPSAGWIPPGFVVEAGPFTPNWQTDTARNNSKAYMPNPLNKGLTDLEAMVAAMRGPWGEVPYLATATSSSEMSFIQGVIPTAANGGSSGATAYMGGWQPTGSAEPGAGWAWRNGETWSWTAWAAGMPNNANSANMLLASRSAPTATSWSDSPEAPTVATVSGQAAVPGAVIEAGMPINWIYNSTTQRWYAFVRAPGIRWDTARDTAFAIQGPGGMTYLATMTSLAERDFIVNSVLPTEAWSGNNGPWLGGYQTSKTTEPGGNWAWITGEPMTYTNWLSGEPNNANNNQEWMQMFQTPTIGWNDSEIDRSSVQGYVVESGTPWTVWSSGTGFNNRGYAYVHKPSPITWAEAHAEAQAMTGPNGQPVYLASITNVNEGNFINSILPPHAFDVDMGPWLGGYQRTGSSEPSGGWTWTSGEVWSYTNWGAGEPNNAGGVENWLHYMRPSSTNIWNDIDASGSNLIYGYVVEYGTPFTWSTWSGNGQSYAWVNTTGLTNAQAKAIAEGIRGPNNEPARLAAITSAAEDTFVRSILTTAAWSSGTLNSGDGPWIGLATTSNTHTATSGWTWPTGEPVQWTDWNAGEPNAGLGAAGFAHLWNAGWGDVGSASTTGRGFLAEIGPTPTWFQWGTNGAWYAFVNDPNQTFSTADTRSTSWIAPNGQTATLASFTRSDEESFVVGQIPASAWRPASTPTWEVGPWFGLEQAIGSVEPNQGWVWASGENTQTYTNWESAEPNEPGGATTTTGANEDFGILGRVAGASRWFNVNNNSTVGTYTGTAADGWAATGYLIKAPTGGLSQMAATVFYWNSTSHPDRTDYTGSQTNGLMNSALGTYDLPVGSASATLYTDEDMITNEVLWWAFGDRGSNHNIKWEAAGDWTVPLNWLSTQLIPGSGNSTLGRVVRLTGTFTAATAADSTVNMTLGTDNGSWLFINGQLAIDNGGNPSWSSKSLATRSMIVAGDNRVDLFYFDENWGGNIQFSSSHRLRPVAAPRSQVNPAKYALSVHNNFNISNSATINIRGNVYNFDDSGKNFGAGSTVRGYWWNSNTWTPTNVTVVDGSIRNTAPVLTEPTVIEADYLRVAQVTGGTVTLTSPNFTTNFSHCYTGTVTLSGTYTGVGTIYADKFEINGDFRAANADSHVVLVARDLDFGISSGTVPMTVDAWIYAYNNVRLDRPTTVNGSLGIGHDLNLARPLTVNYDDTLWRNRTLAGFLRYPGYWSSSYNWSFNATTGNWYAYVDDATTGNFATLRSRAQAIIGPNGRPCDLVSIASTAENTFVWGLIPGGDPMFTSPFWNGPVIGLLAPSGQGANSSAYQWVNGDTATFRNWLAGEPNGTTDLWVRFTGSDSANRRWHNWPDNLHDRYIIETR